MNVTTSQTQVLSKLIDAAALRHRIIGQNISNVNTPGYERKEVQFEQKLAELLAANATSIDTGQLRALKPSIITTENLAKRADGNNVSIEMEIGQLTKNEILYETFTQILASDMAMIRSAITGQ